MSSTLHDQLSRLADEASTPADAAPGRELWDRGTRYRRSLRAGTAGIVTMTAVLLAMIVGADLRAAGPAPEPAPADAPSGLPSVIHEPSRWLPGTDEVGPPGRTVAVFPADRGGWLGTGRGIVAISAATGDYRYLDVPDAALVDDAALSPDGLRIAVWITGQTADTPNTSETGDAPIAGVAVYDTVTGGVVRHDFETSHGLWPESLTWAGPASLVIEHLQYLAGDDGPEMKRSSGDDATTWRWDLPSSEPTQWDLDPRLQGGDWGAPSNGRVALGGLGGSMRLVIVDGTSTQPVPGGAKLNYSIGDYTISPDGTRVAGVWDNNRTPNDVAVLTIGERTPTRLDRAGDTFRVHGWRDDDHVVATRRSEPRPRGGDLPMGVFSVDADTGATEELVNLPEGQFNGVQWATDLLDSPVVDRPAPPTPLDPRWVTGLAAGTLVAAGFALWRWRRRVTP